MTTLKPSHEQLVQEALNSGKYRSVDEFLDEALSAWKRVPALQPSSQTSQTPVKKPLSELFATLRGLDLDLSRNSTVGRPVDL